MASPIIRTGWLHTTVFVENEWGETGTGFLVALRPQDLGRQESEGGLVVVVTNKHVLSEDPIKRSTAKHLRISVNTQDQASPTTTLTVDLRAGPRIREHPDPDTDVLAVNISPEINNHPELRLKWVTFESFALAERRAELDITVGEDVFALGYPVGMRQGGTNLPLVRQGIISTPVGGIIQDKVIDSQGTHRSRTLRAFLVDGATVPGSSGSPVILKPVIGRVVGDSIRLGTSPPVLLGIVAETRYAPVQLTASQAIPGFANLGLVFEVETISETLALFS